MSALHGYGGPVVQKWCVIAAVIWHGDTAGNKDDGDEDVVLKGGRRCMGGRIRPWY